MDEDDPLGSHEGTRVVVRLPPSLSPPDADTAYFSCVVVTSMADSYFVVDADESADQTPALVGRDAVLVSPHAVGGSAVLWVPDEVAQVRWPTPKSTAYYAAVVVSLHSAAPGAERYKARFGADFGADGQPVVRVVSALDMVQEISLEEEAEDGQGGDGRTRGRAHLAPRRSRGGAEGGGHRWL